MKPSIESVPSEVTAASSLAKQAFWERGGQCLTCWEVASHMADAFPDAADAIGMSAGVLTGPKVASFLAKAGLHNEAYDFVEHIVRQEPCDLPIDPQCARNVSAAMQELFAHFMPLVAAQGWRGSEDRELLRKMIPLVSELKSVGYESEQRQYLLTPYFANLLYEAGDLELFDSIRVCLPVQEQGTAFNSRSDIFIPAKQVKLQLQETVLSLVAERMQHWNQSLRNEAILNFWSGAGLYGRVLEKHGSAQQCRTALDFALKQFNLPNLGQTRELVKRKQMFIVMAGMADFIVTARNSGVEITPEDYREMLKPLGEAAKHAGRNWVGPMGAQYGAYQSNMRALLDDLDPGALFKRKPPAPLVNNLCMILTNKQWLELTNNAGRRSIIEDEFCL